MKIQSPPAPMLERLQEVYSTEREQVESKGGSKTEPAASAERPEKVLSPTAAGLESIAVRVLKKEFLEEKEIRAAVIDVVMESKWKALEQSQIAEVKEILLDDPEFSRRVEDMLILAVRELAQRGE